MAGAEFPESYKDASYAALDSATEAKLGLPAGLLASVRENGERSNHSQTNEKGTFSAYQFTPTTRKAILDKYGLDVTLSPENASEGAGLLLQEGLNRNGGDPTQAVGEYTGGLDRNKWGPVTQSYINRVMVGFQSAKAKAISDEFSKWMAANPAQPAAPDAAGGSDYGFGKRADGTNKGTGFLGVLKRPDGGISTELSIGVNIDGKEVEIPSLVPTLSKQEIDHLLSGGAPTPEIVQKASAFARQRIAQGKSPFAQAGEGPGGAAAASANPLDAAFAQHLETQRKSGPEAIPVEPGANTQITPEQPTSIPEKIVGAGEAALSTGTGLTTGALGTAAGAIGGLAGEVLSGQFGTPEAADRVEQAAARGGQALTYTPRTPSGQAQTEAVGEAMQQVIPVAPVLPGIPVTAKPVIEAARPSVQAAGEAISAAGAKARSGAMEMTSKATQKLLGEPAANESQMVGVGAAETAKAAERRTTASQLPVPMELTAGQASRAQEQLRFEGETAKDPNLGGPLRENSAKQNAQLAQNFEAMIDEVGSRAPDSVETGRAVVDKGLVPLAAQAKAKYRTLYQQADKAGEMGAPVNLDSLVSYLNDSAPDAATAPLLNTARQWALKLGIAQDQNGTLVPVHTRTGSSLMNDRPSGAVSLKTAETYRQAINRNTDYEPTNIRQATIIKGLIDQATEGMGGSLYREARAARTRYAQLFENNKIVSDLLQTRRGTADRKVALEDVFRRTILQGSREDLSMLRRTLQVSGDEAGRQAWTELQGATLRYMLDEATKGVGTDIKGNPIFSAAKLQAAVRALDTDGRLDFVLGKRRAQAVRDVLEISKWVTTMPPGAVNTSNTASVILAAIAEAGATGGLTGLPLPVLSTIRLASKHVRDQRIRQRVAAALGKATAKPVKAPVSVVPKTTRPSDPSRAPESRTVH